jgi:phage/plasmid primase-like uncharacterized protein
MIDFNPWGPEPKREIDFATIKAVSLNNIETILHRWMPGGKAVRGEYLCGSIEGGKGESCSTNMTTGVGADFASDCKWGDLIDLVAQRERISMGEAAKLLQEFLHITPDTYISPPVQTVSGAEKRDHAARVSLSLWVEGEACPATHPYLLKKQVNADSGIRFHPSTGNILVPLRDGTDLLGVQRIDANGEKKINHGGMLSGCYHVISGEHDSVYICEGYATAMTVAMATGKTTVMAVSAGNLAAVGKKISKLYPASHLVFAADNDQGGEKNPGIEAAKAAVKKIGRGTVIAPPFPEGHKGDWNDFALLHGGKATRELLLRPVQQKRLFVDVKTMTTTDPAFLIKGVIETPCTGVVFGESGGGKTFVVLDIAFHIASGKKWLGKDTATGPVLYVCGEGRHAIPRRLRAWEQHHATQIPYNRFMMTSTIVDFTEESIDQMITDINQMVEEVTGRPALIIIDTLARHLVGNENATEDMNRFIRECDRLQSEYKCTVLIVHHPGLNDTRRVRGNSALKGALDVEIMVDKGRQLIEWTKTKDMAPHSPIHYELDQIRYGDGEYDNSCVVKYDLEKKALRPETANMKAAIKSLREAVEADGMNGVCLIGTWRGIYYSYLEGVSDRAKQKSFKDNVAILEERNEILVAGNKITAIKMQDDLITQNVFNGVKSTGERT